MKKLIFTTITPVALLALFTGLFILPLSSCRQADRFYGKNNEKVSKMPDWIAGKQDGKKVAVQYALPIRFMLQ